MVGNDKISPCPVCKGIMEPARSCYHWSRSEYGILFVRVRCPRCGHIGPPDRVTSAARQRWNAQSSEVRQCE